MLVFNFQSPLVFDVTVLNFGITVDKYPKIQTDKLAKIKQVHSIYDTYLIWKCTRV